MIRESFMKFNKPLFLTLLCSFFASYLIWLYWLQATSLLSTILSASQPFFVGAGMAYIVNIVMSSYEKVWTRFLGDKGKKLKRPLSLTLSYLTFILVVFLIFSVVLPDLISSLKTLLTFDFSRLETVIRDLQGSEWFRTLLSKTGASTSLSEQVASLSQQLINQVLSLLTNLLVSTTSLASTLMNVLISLIFSIYVLASKEQLARQFSLLIDRFTGRFSRIIYYIFDILHHRFHGFFVSQTLEALILGALTMVGMVLIGLPYAATVSLLVAFTALIPVVGGYIGVLVGFVLIMTQSLNQALIFVLFIVLLQQFEGNLIYPRVVGGSIGLPAMWVLVAITIGGALAGIFGMLVAVPLAASCYQVLKDIIYQKKTENL